MKLTVIAHPDLYLACVLQHLKNLDFTGLGTVHYEHIQAALTTNEEAWKGGRFKDEMFIIQQFCQRIVDLLESLKQRTGHRIANDVPAVGNGNADAPPLTSTSTSTDAQSMPVGAMPRVPRIYNAAAGRIYGGRNWPACADGPFDWARLFGPKVDDDDESGPWLTPRMAARLHHIAIVDGEQLLDDVYFPPDLPRVARPFFKRSKEWRENFRECYLRIGMRLQKGLPPCPNCTGEELALHNIVHRAPDAEDGDLDLLTGLPKFPNDEDYMLVLDNAVEDMDVMMLYEDGDDGCDDDDDEPSVDNPVLGPGSMASFMLGSGGDAMRVNNLHPSEWFHAFRDEDFRNHLP